MTYEYRDYALSVLLTKGKVLISMEKVALYMVKWNDDVMKEISIMNSILVPYKRASWGGREGLL